MTVVRYCKREYDTSVETVISRLNTLEEKLKEGNFVVKTSNSNIQVKDKSIQTKKVEFKKEDKEDGVLNYPKADVSVNEVRSLWHDILNLLKANKKMIIYAYLEPGDVIETIGNKIIIGFDRKYSFSKDNLDKVDNKKVVEEYFSKVLKKDVKVEFKVLGDPMDDEIERAKNIFGDDLVEVME